MSAVYDFVCANFFLFLCVTQSALISFTSATITEQVIKLPDSAIAGQILNSGAVVPAGALLVGALSGGTLDGALGYSHN